MELEQYHHSFNSIVDLKNQIMHFAFPNFVKLTFGFNGGEKSKCGFFAFRLLRLMYADETLSFAFYYACKSGCFCWRPFLVWRRKFEMKVTVCLCIYFTCRSNHFSQNINKFCISKLRFADADFYKFLYIHVIKTLLLFQFLIMLF